METPSLPPPSEPVRTYNLTDKPSQVNVLILLTLLSGIFNIFMSLTGTAGLVLGTMGLGLFCCAPITILPAVLGVFEVLYAFSLMAYPPKPVRPNQTLAVFEIACLLFGNVLALITGIVALILYSDQTVKAYFARINL
jgi:hypothetical protein